MIALFAEKTYTETADEVQRKQIFRMNLKKIEMHNYLHSVGLKSYTLGVNEYADMVSVVCDLWSFYYASHILYHALPEKALTMLHLAWTQNSFVTCAPVSRQCQVLFFCLFNELCRYINNINNSFRVCPFDLYGACLKVLSCSGCPLWF